MEGKGCNITPENGGPVFFSAPSLLFYLIAILFKILNVFLFICLQKLNRIFSVITRKEMTS